MVLRVVTVICVIVALIIVIFIIVLLASIVVLVGSAGTIVVSVVLIGWPVIGCLVRIFARARGAISCPIAVIILFVIVVVSGPGSTRSSVR